MAFTKKQNKEYLHKHGTHCPYCDGTDISQRLQDSTKDSPPDELTPQVTCENCGKVWIEVYKLIGIEKILS